MADPRSLSLRLLYGLSGLGLLVAPVLSWKNVELLGMAVGLPGMLWHGAWLSGVGLFIVALSLRRSWLPLFLAWMAGAILTWREVHTVLTDGDRALLQLQLKLTAINEALGHVGVAPVELYRRTLQGWDSLGNGPRVAVASLGLLALTLGLDLALQMSRGRSWKSVVLGWSRCHACAGKLLPSMHFCPRCAARLTTRPLCSRCFHPLHRSDRFCSRCSEPFSG